MVKPSILRPMILTLKHVFRRPVTIRYPFETLNYPKAFRGLPSVIKDLCTGCGRCIDVCPNKTMEVEEVEGKKAMRKYDRSAQNGEVNLMIGGRLVVEIDGHGVTDDELTAALERVDLGKLATLKPKTGP